MAVPRALGKAPLGSEPTSMHPYVLLSYWTTLSAPGGLVTGDLAMAGKGALRWLIEVGLIVSIGALVLAVKRRTLQPRRAMR